MGNCMAAPLCWSNMLRAGFIPPDMDPIDMDDMAQLLGFMDSLETATTEEEHG